MKTILYLTDNMLEKEIADKCIEQLLKVKGDNPIVSVSQKPMDLGKNVCVGEIGRNWLNLYKQQLEGLIHVHTEFVAIAEHDCLYTEEHFAWEPPDNEHFWYNENCWFVQWHGSHPEMEGQYSRWPKPRYALSQLICPTDMLILSINDRLEMIDCGIRAMRKLGEPGACVPQMLELAKKATDGKASYLKHLFNDHVDLKSKMFETTKPNLDIRHGNNFTGPRRGGRRTFYLPPLGEFKIFMEA